MRGGGFVWGAVGILACSAGEVGLDDPGGPAEPDAGLDGRTGGDDGDGATGPCASAGCDPVATCRVSGGVAFCSCPAGYDDPSGDGTRCTDVDECAAGRDDCDPNASCSNSAGGFACACNPGYSGDGTSCIANVVGALVAVTPAAASGWACNPDGGEAVPVTLTFGDEQIVTVAERDDDAARALCGDARHGFRIAPPLLPEGRHAVTATAAGVPLDGSPITFTSEGLSTYLSSLWQGTVIARPGHDYGPAIVQDAGTWHMWWCAAPSTDGDYDAVWHATSSDGYGWSSPVEVIRGGPRGALDDLAACDPAVIRLGDTWFLYYTAIDVPPDEGGFNRIFVATADGPGGPFTKQPSNDDPQPVLEDAACARGSYCVGQSAVLVRDGVVYHYYTDTGVAGNFPEPSPGATLLATSDDGVEFEVQNAGAPVFDHADVDVKFDESSEMFLMVYGNVDDGNIYWTESRDGFEWLVHDGSRVLDVSGAAQNHNPGMAAVAGGTFSLTTFVTSGAGPSWGIWDMDTTEIVYRGGAVDVPGCGACVGAAADCGGPCVDCGAACVNAGFGTNGYCANPGSADPASCCACVGAP